MIRVLILLMLVSSWSWGCLNDAEVARAEGEFKGRYATPTPQLVEPSGAGVILLTYGSVLGVVVVLLIACRRGWF